MPPPTSCSITSTTASRSAKPQPKQPSSPPPPPPPPPPPTQNQSRTHRELAGCHPERSKCFAKVKHLRSRRIPTACTSPAGHPPLPLHCTLPCIHNLCLPLHHLRN